MSPPKAFETTLGLSGGRRSDRIALLDDDKVKIPKADGRYEGVVNAGATIVPRSHVEVPRWRRLGFHDPNCFVFVIEGEVEAPETDHRFENAIDVAVAI